MIDIILLNETKRAITNLNNAGVPQSEIAFRLKLPLNEVENQCATNTRKLQYEYKTTDLWNEDDTEYLIEYYAVTTLKDLAYALGKTRNQVTSRVNLLQRGGYIPWKSSFFEWTEENEAYLIKNLSTMPRKELAEHLGVDITVLNNKIKQIYRENPQLTPKRKKVEWPKEEVNTLKSLYQTHTYDEIAIILRKNRSNVQSKLTKMFEAKILEPVGRGYRQKGAKNV